MSLATILRALHQVDSLLQSELCARSGCLENFSWWMIVGIVGGGISGLALALALQKRKIQSVLWEKDESFEDRKQGYGLTIQQGKVARI